jgi:hypothetical protein
MTQLVKKGTARRRPAELAGSAAATVGLAAGLATGNTQAIVTAAVGYVPLVWTFLKVNGGVKGVWRTIVHGS